METVKRVHMIYKTHLDIGFTDFSANIVKNYVDVFIPKAIDLATELNTPEKKLFVWSVGSWLIDYYLKHTTGAKREKLVDAITKGHIVWHGLPFTTHTELMNGELVDYGLSLSAGLDNIFGINTIACKMTDVPGHTIGLVQHLAQVGIRYMHLGVNDASHKPDVPDTFVWRDSKGNDVIVDYCQGYGNITQLPFMEDVLAFCHSGDNLGPPSVEEVLHNVAVLSAQYPNAQVFASDLNQYAQALLPYQERLPVVDWEIGDTWIHGVMSDPYKTGLFKEYLATMSALIQQNAVTETEKSHFFDAMLLVPEHTWGMDWKKYLSDYKNWKKADFQIARKKDVLDDSLSIPAYADCYAFAKEEFSKQIKNLSWEERSYSIFEQSHQEQRDYLTQAVVYLSPETQQVFQKVNQDYDAMRICEKLSTFEKVADRSFEIGGFSIVVEDHGRVLVDEIPMGFVSYELFGTETFERYKAEYGHDYENNHVWASPDNFKCGYEFCGAPRENILHVPKVKEIYKNGYQFIVHSCFDETVVHEQGCPRDVYVMYTLEKQCWTITLNLLGKDANRMPEALWFTLLDGVGTKPVALVKLGEVVNPEHVVLGGNRSAHVVEKATMCGVEVVPHHSPLLCVGARRLYDFNQQFAAPSGGFHFNLYNNLWNTNFKMWYEEDIQSVFTVAVGQ